jgi:hypothetical protein
MINPEILDLTGRLAAAQSRLQTTHEHVLWVRASLAQQLAHQSELAQAGNAHSAGWVSGVESALRYLSVLDGVLGVKPDAPAVEETVSGEP